MNGVIRIEFQIVDQQLRLMVHGPMKNEAEKSLTIQVLAQAIPIVLNYDPSPILKPGAPGLITPQAPAAPKTH